MNTAIELLSEILKHRDHLVKTDSLKNLSMNPLMESELEELFIEALRSFRTEETEVALRQEVVKGRPGWYLNVNDRRYFIVPQVELGPAEGVAVPARADFVFYPEFSRDGKPVAVFTDGFMYHAGKGDHNRIGKDMAQRMAIVRSGRYIVWSLSWDDVQNSIHKTGGYYDNYLGDRIEKVNGLQARYDDLFKVKRLAAIQSLSSMDMFLKYLACPDPKMWEMYALIHGLVHLDCVCKEEQARSAADLLWKDMHWRDIQLETIVSNSGNCLVGQYQKNCEDSPLIKLTASLDKEDYIQNRFQKMSVICRFFDEDDLLDKSHFKSAWNGFIRMYNIYQFIPEAIFVSSKGISEGHYLWLMSASAGERDRVQGETNSLDALKTITPAHIHPLLAFLLDNSLPLPEAGFELCDEKDEIIATAELGWPERKVVFLRNDEKMYAQIFSAKGWQADLLDDVLADYSLCLKSLS